jgi:hypothetical protein
MSVGIYRVRGRKGSPRRARWYPGTSTPPYQGPDCPGTFAGLVSASLPQGARHRTPYPERHRSPPNPMKTDLAARAWRLATVIGPLLAIALTLAAGRRW